MMSQFSANGQAQQGRPRGRPRGRGRGRGRGQAQPNPHGVINLDDDPVFYNIHEPAFHVNPQTPVGIYASHPPVNPHPPPPVAGPSRIIRPAHVIGGAQADPHVDGLNRGHIARRDNAAGRRRSISAYHDQLSQQNHRNQLALQQHDFQIGQPMHHSQAPNQDDAEQLNGDEENDAHMSQNHQQFRQSQALDEINDEDFDENQHPDLDAELEEHLRQIEEEEAEISRQRELPTARKAFVDPANRHSLGPMNIECQHCRALHFDGEKLSDSTRNNKKFGLCCLQGQIKLDLLPEPPQTLRDLLYGRSLLSPKFRNDIRSYNAAFAFTSVGVKVDESVTRGSGPYSFKIGGELHHLTGSLLPEGQEEPMYAQLYVHDPSQALGIRQRRNPRLDSTIMTDLQAMLHETHPYVPLYKQMYQLMADKPPEEQQNIAVRLHMSDETDQRRYNLPTVEEIAAVIPGDGTERRSDHRDIIVRLRGGALKRISHLHQSYSTLHYTMLFPRGESGFHPGIPAGEGGRSNTVSSRCYYAYRLHQRPNEPTTVLRGGKLLQQYVVDAWASTEQSELNWIRHHQKELRADVYQGLRDQAAQPGHDTDMAEIGQRIILPSSHSGSPRHMYQLFQDSMAICRFCRKPDIFLTMTANPNWPEIQEALLKDEGDNPNGKKQTAADRPDIVARVFQLKKEAVLKEIREGLFGKVGGLVHTIEFQKRGLPHMHLLIFLRSVHIIYNSIYLADIFNSKLSVTNQRSENPKMLMILSMHIFLILRRNPTSMLLLQRPCSMVPVVLIILMQSAWSTVDVLSDFQSSFKSRRFMVTMDIPRISVQTMVPLLHILRVVMSFGTVMLFLTMPISQPNMTVISIAKSVPLSKP